MSHFSTTALACFNQGKQLPLTNSYGSRQKQLSLEDVIKQSKPEMARFQDIYKDLHLHPELSRVEERTSNVIAEYLRSLDFEVHDKIGGFGVVGVLENGPGPTVMLRAELDALPIEEKTNVSYASNHRMKDWWGREQPVMHACGHDMHMTCLMASAQLLLNSRSTWAGTLITVFQPNEEHTGGARAMIESGLYDQVPIPDVVMAQHGMHIRSGQVSIKQGPVLVSADTMEIRIFSSMGHPSNPQVNIDSVVVASRIILRLQDLVKNVAGEEYASISVEEIHAGQPGQDWVDHTDLVLDVKSYNPKVREKLLDSISNLVQSECRSSEAVNPPKIKSSSRAPLTSNDPKATEQIREAFKSFFDVDNVLEQVPSHPCEDFSILASAHNVPYVFWFLGRVNPDAMKDAEDKGKVLDLIPIEHSPFNAPEIEPTLETGMNALALAALTYLAKDGKLGT